MKRYFENEDAENCFTEDYFQDKMVEYHVDEMVVLEAVPSNEKEFIYCVEYGEVGEASECGRELCEKYKPRNGKNGCCRFRRTMYEHGEEVVLRSHDKKLKNV